MDRKKDFLIACLKKHQCLNYNFDFDADRNQFVIYSTCLKCKNYTTLVPYRAKGKSKHPANIRLICSNCRPSNPYQGSSKKELYLSYLKDQQLEQYDIIVDDRTSKIQIMSSCLYCQVFTVLTKDHIVPVAYGGSHTTDNIAMVCERCNLSKADQTLEEWYPNAHPQVQIVLDDLLAKGINGSFKPFDPHNIDYSRPKIKDFNSAQSRLEIGVEPKISSPGTCKPKYSISAPAFNSNFVPKSLSDSVSAPAFESRSNSTSVSNSTLPPISHSISPPTSYSAFKIQTVSNLPHTSQEEPVHCYVGPLTFTPPNFI